MEEPYSKNVSVIKSKLVVSPAKQYRVLVHLENVDKYLSK